MSLLTSYINLKTITMYTIKLTPQQAEEVYYAMLHYITSEADVSFLSDLNEAQESQFEAELHVIKQLFKNF